MLVSALMSARSMLRTSAAGSDARASARTAIHSAKVHLGERGPVWWTDGAPDYNRRMVKNTPYASWYEGLPIEARR